ncbi:hypothetical protein K469DRAFT_17511 [Zopfia rhizophila CBS 207.26]|uniref:Uncharacterized protein n=1 Tax=Zopfia rhizophila CBS 207.26 TaxID=1314779 RepID=A0A6A6EY43_9PEZI|nr:hypothetical protein K469DRAFT_17511 [Zopfia rhizophila CBS 207.26]
MRCAILRRIRLDGILSLSRGVITRLTAQRAALIGALKHVKTELACTLLVVANTSRRRTRKSVRFTALSTTRSLYLVTGIAYTLRMRLTTTLLSTIKLCEYSENKARAKSLKISLKKTRNRRIGRSTCTPTLTTTRKDLSSSTATRMWITIYY